MQKPCLLILFLLLCCGVSPAFAADILYDGDATKLKTSPEGERDALFPVSGTSPSASGNTITIDYTTGTDPFIVYGGYSQSDTSSGNTVTLTRGSVEDGIRGGFSKDGKVENNTVIIEGGSVTDHYVYGGFAYNGGAATKNKVEVYGGQLIDIYGGANAVGSVAGDVTGNEVIIHGGTMRSVVGGLTRSSLMGKVLSGNIVTINSGTVGGVYGAQDTAFHPDSIARNNTVNFHDGTISYLFGGIAMTSEGNKLNMFASNKKVEQMGMFQTYNFILPANTKNGDVILTVKNFKVALSTAKVNVTTVDNNSALKAGDAVTLIDSAKGFDTNTPKKGKGIEGYGTIYDFDLSVENGAGDQQLLIATVPGGPPKPGGKNPQTKALLEGALGSFALVSQGAEMVAGKGMSSAVNAANESAASGPVAFGSLSGSMSRYNTGSHVKVESVNFLAGLGWNAKLNEGRNGSILAGVFFESGFGNYNAHNSFSSSPSVHGKGDTRYFGGGVLGRYTLPSGLYAEGSLRAGKVKNDYSSKDFINNRGEKADFDSSVAYFGAHGGLGYLWQFRENTRLDVFSKYMWTHQNDDTVKLGKERLHLDKVNSHRWQTGARLEHEVILRNGVVTTPFVGAAFDYEFGGRQKGSLKSASHNWKIDSPTLKGGTGIGEFGLTLKPSATSRVSLGLSVQGYAGKREGVGGNMNLRYEF